MILIRFLIGLNDNAVSQILSLTFLGVYLNQSCRCKDHINWHWQNKVQKHSYTIAYDLLVPKSTMLLLIYTIQCSTHIFYTVIRTELLRIRIFYLGVHTRIEQNAHSVDCHILHMLVYDQLVNTWFHHSVYVCLQYSDTESQF